MKKKVAIIGTTGMLGSMTYNVLQKECNLILIYRNPKYLSILDKTYGSVKRQKLLQFDFFKLYKEYTSSHDFNPKEKSIETLAKRIGNIDAIINCAGIIKTNIVKNPTESIFINGFLPNILSQIYKEKLIHVTTDCVFNGKSGTPYNENSTKTPNDLYGLSKSIGEPNDSLVFRTSIFGPEIHSFTSLFEWVKNQNKKKIYGFTNHLWNGITTKTMANIFLTVIQNRKKFPKKGTYHIFSNAVSKYEMIQKIIKKYGLSTQIIPKKVNPIDRRLTTVYGVCKTLHIPSFDQMLSEL